MLYGMATALLYNIIKTLGMCLSVFLSVRLLRKVDGSALTP